MWDQKIYFIFLLSKTTGVAYNITTQTMCFDLRDKELNFSRRTSCFCLFIGLQYITDILRYFGWSSASLLIWGQWNPIQYLLLPFWWDIPKLIYFDPIKLTSTDWETEGQSACVSELSFWSSKLVFPCFSFAECQ